MSIGNRLKIVRGNKTQFEFAKILSVHPNTIARYERGERKPDAEYIERIFKRFNISPRWLLSGEGEMYPLKKNKADNSKIEGALDQYEKAGVIPDYSVSDDEFAIIKLLRFIPNSEAKKIIQLIYDIFLSYPPASTYEYLRKSRMRVAAILMKEYFDKGIDVEQKLFDNRELQKENDIDEYNLEIQVIAQYEKAENKEEFIKKLKRVISKTKEK